MQRLGLALLSVCNVQACPMNEANCASTPLVPHVARPHSNVGGDECVVGNPPRDERGQICC
jgi:hypothetical protein